MIQNSCYKPCILVFNLIKMELFKMGNKDSGNKILKSQKIRDKIFALSKDYYENEFPNNNFKPGDVIPYSGKIFDHSELINLVDSSLDFWLTAGRYADEFEKRFSNYMGQKYCLLVYSGSSANLIALTTLTSPSLGDRRLVKGDEVITVSAGFPTTVAPIIQNGLVPVFVDVEIGSYNIDVSMLQETFTKKLKQL